METNYGIHWFRRDLRVAGNPALHSLRSKYRGRVLGLFCIDEKFLSRPDFSAPRFAFFLETLRELKKELQESGGDLLVIQMGPMDAFSSLIEKLKASRLPLPQACSFNRDYEPFARERDDRVTRLLVEKLGMEVHTERDHLILEPGEILKPNRTIYQIYTPFARKWFESFSTQEIQLRVQAQQEGLNYLEKRAAGNSIPPLFELTWEKLFGKHKTPDDCLDQQIKKNQPLVKIDIPKAGSLAAWSRAQSVIDRIKSYKTTRDLPYMDGTSQMSIYFKNGSFTTAQAIALFGLEKEQIKNETGYSIYLKELVWREFYYHILYHRPSVENQAYLEKFRQIRWENREDLFEAWKQGKTGYPIVDAGMRQLNETGWMHNRVRMIVASFLTKDLLVDWQWGENYFMRQLLDGDLAPNNGGWQWAASTGCDPQPYFRIFNPTLQSQKFDPKGEYIRKYVPELRHMDSRKIHVPQNPVVDHAARKLKTLLLYRTKSLSPLA